MRYPALDKFMNSMGIYYELKIQRTYRENGRPCVCIEVIVYYDDNEEYVQFHCYKLLRNFEVIYTEGNEIISIRSGVLGHLGQDDLVDNYFENLSRQMARNYFEKEFPHTSQ
jgi:hypothetical protein